MRKHVPELTWCNNKFFDGFTSRWRINWTLPVQRPECEGRLLRRYDDHIVVALKRLFS